MLEADDCSNMAFCCFRFVSVFVCFVWPQFSESIVEEAVYEMILPQQRHQVTMNNERHNNNIIIINNNLFLFHRQQLHAAAAAWYEHTHRDILLPSTTLLAHHYFKAEQSQAGYDPSRELDTEICYLRDVECVVVSSNTHTHTHTHTH
jgi:hypothetical protein